MIGAMLALGLRCTTWMCVILECLSFRCCQLRSLLALNLILIIYYNLPLRRTVPSWFRRGSSIRFCSSFFGWDEIQMICISENPPQRFSSSPNRCLWTRSLEILNASLRPSLSHLFPTQQQKFSSFKHSPPPSSQILLSSPNPPLHRRKILPTSSSGQSWSRNSRPI